MLNKIYASNTSQPPKQQREVSRTNKFLESHQSNQTAKEIDMSKRVENSLKRIDDKFSKLNANLQ